MRAIKITLYEFFESNYLIINILTFLPIFLLTISWL